MTETIQYQPGQICHTEVISKDVEATKTFMTKTFGWTYDDMPSPDGSTYTMWKVGGQVYGGITPPMAPEVPPMTLNYLTVADIKATAAAVVANGGSIHKEPMEIPGMGWMLVFEVPGGTVMAAWQAA